MSRIRTPALLALVAVSVGLAAAISVIRPQRGPMFHGTDVGRGTPAAGFRLVSAGAEAVSLDDFRGRAVLLFFGYTTCPDVCPLTLARLAEVMERLGDARERVQVLLITVDPDVDDPDRVDAYVRGFDPAFRGLGGEPGVLRAVARAYGVYASDPSAPVERLRGHEEHGDERAHGLPPRLIAHSSYLFGIAPDGALRVLWSGDATAGEIAADVLALLDA